MTTDVETVVRRAYNLAEGSVMDVPGFIGLFADDGVIHAGLQTFSGAERARVVEFVAMVAPNVHRELHRVHAIGDFVAIELSIRGTFSGRFESPAGVIHGNGAKLDVPCADFWYVEGGKIKQFNCHVAVDIMLQQIGIELDYAAAVKAQAARR